MRRQRHDWDRDALDALRAGDVGTWAAAYRDHSRIVARPTADATRTELVSDWWRAGQERGADAVMIAHRRSDVADLNGRARALLRELGHLGEAELDVGGRRFAVGDRVVVSRNDRRLGVINGDRGEVTGVDLDRRTAELRLSAGGTVDLDAAYLDDGHLDHGYALTAHKAQGATVDRAFVLGSDELYREWGYTALSRHREEARFYVVSPASVERNLPGLEPDEDPIGQRLVEMLGESQAKTLALDHVPNAAHDALARFAAHSADEGRAKTELARAEQARDETQERLEQMQAERAGLGRIFHRRERAALDVHIASNERALSFWQTEVDRSEEALAAVVAERSASAEQEIRAHDRDALRQDLAPERDVGFDLGP